MVWSMVARLRFRPCRPSAISKGDFAPLNQQARQTEVSHRSAGFPEVDNLREREGIAGQAAGDPFYVMEG
jgi:hypothetical protein